MTFSSRLFELIFSVAVAKYILPALNQYKEEVELQLAAGLASEVVKTRKAAAAKKRKLIAAKKSEVEKGAKEVFQARFEGPLGQGLRVFRPEPQKG